MVGQKKLTEKLNSLTFVSFTCPYLFIGPVGCGKRVFAQYAAKILGIPFVEITREFTRDDLSEICICPIPKLYYIDLSEFTEAQQSQFLKFIEEPGKNMRLILGTVSETRVLDTILNRCIRYNFEKYTVDELKEITHKEGDLIYKVFSTPGLINGTDDNELKTILNFANGIITNIAKSPVVEVMNWSTRINYKEEYDKIDFYKFFIGLRYVAFNTFMKNNDKIFYKAFLAATEAIKELEFKGISKENFMVQFLLHLKEVIS